MLAQERVEDYVKNQWMESIWSGKTTRARTETTTTTTAVSNKKNFEFLMKARYKSFIRFNDSK